MKKQTKSNLQISLQSLGIIFLMFFAMAFACKDDTKTSNPDKSVTTSSGGGCSTEREFKDVLTKSWSQTFGNTKKFKEMEVEFHSFKVAKPIYNWVSHPGDVNFPAYPVMTSFTTRYFFDEGSLGKNVFETRAADSEYYFYVNVHGNCDFRIMRNTQNSEKFPYEE